MAGNVSIIECKNVGEFLASISPGGPLDQLSPSSKGGNTKGDPRDWLFRGQREATWGLIPSAFRDVTWLEGSNDEWKQRREWANGGEIWTHARQVAAEWRLLKDFFILTNVQGLRLPGDWQKLRDRFDEFDPMKKDPDSPDKWYEKWPHKKFWPLVALCQHYRIPTRLLDWSRKPLVAAYFACEAVAREQAQPAKAESGRKPGNSAPGKSTTGCPRIAVWAWRRRWAERRGVSTHTEFYRKLGIREVHAPRASNPNLHMQSGLFTLVKGKRKKDDEPEPQDLKTILENAGSTSLAKPPRPLLYKITLPQSQARELLARLRDRFVQGATIYAGYEGVARSVLEKHARGPL